MDKTILGSQTAKNGFKNERSIADKFNNWQNDYEAKIWLKIMNYDLSKIEFVKAFVISGHKADINVQVQVKLKEALDIENIQVKLVSNKAGFNQVDKRWVKTYQKMWNIPNDILELLKYFTGETPPYKTDIKDKRRMFSTEFSQIEQDKIVNWFENNKTLIVSDILRGRGEFSAEWVLVAQKIPTESRWVLKNINQVMQFYTGDVEITS